MEKEKNKNGVNLLLIFIIVILAVLCVLFATGTISFMMGNNTNKENISDNNNITTINANNINNIDSKTLSELLQIIGLNDINNTKSICNTITQIFLNGTDSRLDSYSKDQARWLVLSYYKLYYNQNDDSYQDYSKCLDPGTPVPQSSCYSFDKNLIKEIVNKYDLKYTVDELFADNKQDNDNYYVTYGSSGICGGIIETTHSISSWYGYNTDRDKDGENKDFITIRDEITIKYDKNPYDDITSRVIYYTFKLYDENYKLWLYRIN